MADQLYFVDGYLDDNYFAVVAEASASLSVSSSVACELTEVDTTGYYLDDYIAEGYISDGVVHEAAAALVVSSTANASPGIVKSSGADLNGVFAPNILAVASRNGSIDMALQTAFASDFERTRTTDVTLDNIVNLSLQSARIRDTAMALAATFAATPIVSRTRSTSSSLAISFEQTTNPLRIKQLDATLSGVFSPNIQATASLNGSIDLHATASADATATRIKQLDATLSTAFTSVIEGGYKNEATVVLGLSSALSATAISFVAKTEYPNNRPKTITFPFQPNTWVIDTVDKKHGSGSAKNVQDNTGIDRLSIAGIPGFDRASTNSYTVEWWYKTSNFSATTTNKRMWWQSSIGDSIEVNIDRTYQTSGVWYADFILYSTLANRALTVTGVPFAPNTWHHFAVQQKPASATSSTFQFVVDNAYSDATSQSVTANPNTTASYQFFTYDGSLGDYTNYDSISVRIGNNSNAYIPVQGWSSEPANSENDTHALFLFNGDFDDGPVFMTLYGAADLATTASLTASASGTSGAQSDLTATATITADVDKVVNTSATLATAFATTATALKILTLDSTLSSEFATTADATRIQQGNLALNSAFAQTAAANVVAGAVFSDSASFELSETTTRIKQIAASLNAFVSTLAAAGKVGDFFVDVDLQANLNAIANISTSAASELTATATATATALRIQNSAVDLTAQSTIAVAGQTITSNEIQVNFAATLETNVDKLYQLDSATSSEFNLSAVAINLGVIVVETTVLSDVSATALRIKQIDSALDSTATVTANAIRAVEAIATLAGVFAPSIQAVASRNGSIDIAVDSTVTASAIKIKSLNSTANSEFNLSAEGIIAKGSAEAQLVNTATVTAVVDRRRNTTSELELTATQTTTATRAVEAIITLNGVFTPSIQAVANRVGESEFTAQISVAALANIVASSTATAALQAALASSPTMIAAPSATLVVGANITALGGLLTETQSQLGATTNLTAQGGVIDVERYVYLIPKETRVSTVNRETRTHTIHQETRTFSLGEL